MLDRTQRPRSAPPRTRFWPAVLFLVSMPAVGCFIPTDDGEDSPEEHAPTGACYVEEHENNFVTSSTYYDCYDGLTERECASKEWRSLWGDYMESTWHQGAVCRD